MKHKRIYIFNGMIGVVVSLTIGLVFLVACGETPTPTNQPLPTSTVQLLTLPVPPTSNNQPTVTLGVNGSVAAANTATAAVFGDTRPPAQPGNLTATPAASDTTSAALQTGTVVSTTNPPDSSGPNTPTPMSPTTVVGSDTATATPIVPTQNVPPPTQPIGISPNPPPIPTQPIAVSPAVINNTASVGEQRFELDLGGFKAEASLEYPKATAGPYATILMFQPFGLYDLDATVTTSRFGIGSRNYKVLADQLALRGYAVIRYTKRGYDASGQNQNPAQDTPLDQLISDANVVFEQIKANSLLDSHKLILLGEDEGATVAMRLAQKQPDVAGLILIAPISDPRAAWHYQTVDAPVAYAHQTLDRDKDGSLSVQEWTSAPHGTYLAAFQNVALDAGKFTSLISTGNPQATDIERDLKPYLEKTFEAGQGNSERAAYLTSLFKSGDTTPTLASFKKPVLILQGELDQQVPLAQGAALDAYLAQQGNSDHSLLKYPKLGHSLYKLDRSGADVLGPLDINLDPPNNPLNDMLGWLNQHYK